jgi:hypothetical protein
MGQGVAELATTVGDDVEAAPSTRAAPVVSPAWSRRDLLWPIACYLVSRLGVFLVAKMATWLEPTLPVTTVLTGWDGGWFLQIAELGYPGTTASEGAGNRWAFFPALPGAIRVVAETTGLSYQVAGVLVAFLVGLAAAVAVWFIVRDLFGKEIANGTVALFCFYPPAFTLTMVYADGLLIALAAACMALLLRQRWLLASLAAAAAGATRNVGVVVILMCLVAAVTYRPTRPVRIVPRLSVLVAPVGFLLWCWYQWDRTGEPFAFQSAQASWQNSFSWFTTPLRSLWRILTERSAWSSAPDVLAAAAFLFAAAGVVLLVRYHLRHRPLPVFVWVYVAGMVLASMSPYWATSILRYTMPLFPVMAAWIATLPRSWRTPFVATSATLQGGLALVAFASLVAWQTAPFAP